VHARERETAVGITIEGLHPNDLYRCVTGDLITPRGLADLRMPALLLTYQVVSVIALVPVPAGDCCFASSISARPLLTSVVHRVQTGERIARINSVPL